MTVHQSLLPGCIFENFIFGNDTVITGTACHSSSEHDFSGSLLFAIRQLRQLFRRCECYFVVVLYPAIELSYSVTDIRRAWYGIDMRAVPSFESVIFIFFVH